jgi:hypothetical protein
MQLQIVGTDVQICPRRYVTPSKLGWSFSTCSVTTKLDSSQYNRKQRTRYYCCKAIR